ncbi:beta-propeller fold lactonase family protein, partial [Streptomyces sp. NPDC127084]|uniref:YVTN family beta-propeller repeat protein n=1 Tax=Streptomyces sp. NPDC127084 TaxID=3347133 RepID=UPI00365A262D
PQVVAVSPDGTRAYVTNLSSNSVSVIDTATNTVSATIAAVGTPFGVAVSPDGTRIYVTNVGANTVSVIDTATNTVIATVAVGTEPFGVAVTPDGTRAYVTNGNATTVSVIDTATNTVIATVAVGTDPLGVAIGVLADQGPAVWTLLKTASDEPFVAGGQGSYTLTATNSGSEATDGSTVTLADVLPAGLTPVSLSGTGWTCVLDELSCTREDVLGAGESYPPLTLTVDIAKDTARQVTNRAIIEGGGAGAGTAAATTIVKQADHKPAHKPAHKPKPKPQQHGRPDHGHGKQRPGPR